MTARVIACVCSHLLSKSMEGYNECTCTTQQWGSYIYFQHRCSSLIIELASTCNCETQLYIFFSTSLLENKLNCHGSYYMLITCVSSFCHNEQLSSPLGILVRIQSEYWGGRGNVHSRRRTSILGQKVRQYLAIMFSICCYSHLPSIYYGASHLFTHARLLAHAVLAQVASGQTSSPASTHKTCEYLMSVYLLQVSWVADTLLL